jgi:hypothetical protein
MSRQTLSIAIGAVLAAAIILGSCVLIGFYATSKPTVVVTSGGAGTIEAGGFDWSLFALVLTGFGTTALAVGTGALAWSTSRDVRASQRAAQAASEANELHRQDIEVSELARLVETFEARELMVLVWRIEQLTRPDRDMKDSVALDRIDLVEVMTRTKGSTSKRALVELMLSGDWAVQRAGMHEVYFFALRVHAWLVSSARGRDECARQLNDTFGYQLLSTLLDHRSVAIRLRDPVQPDTYYPTQYGCLDPPCRDLVSRLAKDFLGRPEATSARAEIRERMALKWGRTDAELTRLAAVPPAVSA